MTNVNMKLVPSSVELQPLIDADDGQPAAVAVRINAGQSWPDETIDSVTVPFEADAALALGAQLIAYSDWLSGRPVRDWSTFNA